MINLLRTIVELFVCWVQTGLTLAFNAVIAGLGALWGFVVGLLPDMPEAPTLPAVIETGFQWVNWAIPFAWFLGYFATYLILVVAVFAVMTLLRWLKVVE